MSGDLISREALKEAFKIEELYWGKRIIDHIDNAPTVELDMAQVLAYESGKASNERPKGEWEDYSVDFYRCPECGYLLNKDCPHCQNKVILPISDRYNEGFRDGYAQCINDREERKENNRLFGKAVRND